MGLSISRSNISKFLSVLGISENNCYEKNKSKASKLNIHSSNGTNDKTKS